MTLFLIMQHKLWRLHLAWLDYRIAKHRQRMMQLSNVRFGVWLKEPKE